VATHKGINYTVQGSAYDLLAETLVKIEDAGLGDAVYLSMHDELIMSTCAADDIRKIMETPPERLCEFSERVPILRTDRLDLGIRWAVA
jgi:DNA polymerase-1